MTQQLLVDIYEGSDDSERSWSYQDRSEIPEEILNESKVDNVSIVGRVVGEMFAVDGKSGNKRFYSRKLWENAIGKTKGVIGNGMMFGTIGHNQPIDEKAILEGKISHRISRLWIDESTRKGMGEILILGTDSGKNLNAILKSGAKFPVSSRAFGEYSGKTNEGLDIVNPDTYELKGFDFVINPGISSAIPSIVESLTDSENQMSDTTVLTALTEEKIQISRQLNEAKATIETLTGRAELAESRLETTKTVLAKYEALGTPEDLKNISESYQTLNTSKLELEGQVVAYKYLGTPEKIEEAMNLLEAQVDAFTDLGTPEHIEECLNILESYIELGKTDDLHGLTTTLKQYQDLGTVEQISESLDISIATLSKFKELGTLAQIEEVLDLTSAYAELGSPEEIKEALERSLAFIESHKSQQRAVKNEALAKELGITTEILESMGDKTPEEITAIVNAIKSTSDKNKSTVSERYKVTDDKNTNINEDNSSDDKMKNQLDESRSARLMRNLSH